MIFQHVLISAVKTQQGRGEKGEKKQKQKPEQIFISDWANLF
jgi:hypothetical protein